MAPTSTSVDGLETVETRTHKISRAPQARPRCAGGRANGGELPLTVAPPEHPTAGYRSFPRLLRPAWASRPPPSRLVLPPVPPATPPPGRSCGRGEWATTPPMPIFED